jgi:hypothetical protein
MVRKERPGSALACCPVSAYEDRLESLRQYLDDAKEEIAGLPKEQREQYPDQTERLEHVIAFAAMALERTDAEMVSDQALSEIQSASQQITANATTAVTNAAAYSDQLLLATLKLPVAVGREVEQNVKETAANFQRSAAQRLNSLREDFATAKSEITDLDEQIAQRFEELSRELETATSNVQAKLAELEQTIEVQRQGLDELSTRHSSSFSEAQEERSATFQEELAKYKEQLDGIATSTREDVEERVAEIRRMEKESSELVGAIGLAGTAERYSEEVKEQAEIANRWRWATILFGLAAAAVAIYAVVAGDQSNQDIVAKLAVSLILGGIAAYVARQSARHRRREEQARRLQLELTAFGPFIEPLQPEQREEERVVMTRKTFGKSTEKAAPEEEPGPTPLSFLLRRREKELKEQG